jgi:hypothetical protein
MGSSSSNIKKAPHQCLPSPPDNLSIALIPAGSSNIIAQMCCYLATWRCHFLAYLRTYLPILNRALDPKQSTIRTGCTVCDAKFEFYCTLVQWIDKYIIRVREYGHELPGGEAFSAKVILDRLKTGANATVPKQICEILEPIATGFVVIKKLPS